MAEASKPTPTPVEPVEASKPAEAVEEVLPAKLAVKNISKSSVYLSFGEIKPGESGECSKSEYENFAGVYLEKA